MPPSELKRSKLTAPDPNPMPKSLPTIKRLESKPGPPRTHSSTVAAIARAFEAARVEFTNRGSTWGAITSGRSD